MACQYEGCAHNGPLTVADWAGATEDAIALLRRTKGEHLRNLDARTFAEAQRLGYRDDLCRRIDSAREKLEAEADGFTYLPAWTPLRNVIGAIYDYEAIS